jgi:hypothetical protein
MQITLEELALAASTNTDVALLTAALAEDNNFLSLSALAEEDGYIDLAKLAERLIDVPETSVTTTNLNHYDRLIEQYLGEGYKPLTLANIHVPEDFKIETVDEATNKVRELLIQNNEAQLKIFEHNPDTPNIGNAFAIFKEDGTSILNEAAIAKKIEFLEFIKTIPLEEVQANPIEVARKVLFLFNESCKPLLVSMPDDMPNNIIEDTI